MALKALLTDTQNAFSNLSNLVSEQQGHWTFSPAADRWTFAEHAEHLWKVGLGITSVLRRDDAFFTQFPALDRKPFSFNELKANYQEKAKFGLPAPGNVRPESDLSKSTDEFLTQWTALLGKTSDRLLSFWTPERLLHKTIPHAAFGMISVQELLFFQDFHIDHHVRILEKEYLKLESHGH